MNNTTVPDRLDKMTPANLTEVAENFGKKLSDRNSGIKTNQVRNVFAHVNRMRVDFKQEGWNADLERSLILLKPKLAYAAGRQKKESYKEFQNLMSQAIDAVVASDDKPLAVQNFFALVEGIVAYHKFHGGD